MGGFQNDNRGPRLGDHAWRDVLRQHDSIVEEATTAQGGTVVKTLGDGSMLAFSSARRAVACAQEIQFGIDQVFVDTHRIYALDVAAPGR